PQSSTVVSLSQQGIKTRLMQMFEVTNSRIRIKLPQLWLIHESILLLPNGTQDRDKLLNGLGDICLRQYQTFQAMDYLSQAICAYDDSVRDGLADATCLGYLGAALLRRFERLGDPSDLNKSIARLETSVRLTPDSHPSKGRRLQDTGTSLLRRFNLAGDLADINKSVLRLEESVGLTVDGHPDKPRRLHELGGSLFNRFETLGDLDDVDKAVSMFREAVQLMPDGHTDKGPAINNLGVALVRRLECQGDPGDLNSSFLLLQDAVQLNPENPSFQSTLGQFLALRFDRLSNLDDINKSILALEEAVRLCRDSDPEKPIRMNDLGGSLCRRFERLANPADINRAILTFEDAVKLTPNGHPDRLKCLGSLGTSLFLRFDRLGDVADVNKSVLLFEDTIRCLPENDPDKFLHITSLGTSLCCRFQRLGKLADINKAISAFQDALQVTPENHPGKARMLNDLGYSLRCRFERLGDLGDINTCILMYEEAVQHTPDGHYRKAARLANLGVALCRRFEQFANMADIDKAISVLEDAIQITPDDHPDKSIRLGDLGNSLLIRFEHFGNPTDLDRGLIKFEDAVQLTPDTHPDKLSRLSNLGNGLRIRFQKLGKLADIDRSIGLLGNAVHLTPDGHPHKALWLLNSSNSLACRFNAFGSHSDLEQMILQYSSSACSTTSPVFTRFNASTRWAEHAQASQHSSLLHAYEVAMGLLPELAWLGLSIRDRHRHILQAGKVVRNAAAAAISASQFNTAVEWLEQGRSVIWGQLLNLRTPVDDLRHTYPAFAEKLVFLSTMLEAAGTHESRLELANAGSKLLPEHLARRYHDHALERNELLEQIRGLEGFSDFLLPRKLSDLLPAAKEGSVIILNVSEVRCDALILRPGENQAMHTALPDFALNDAENLVKCLGTLLYGAGRSERLIAGRKGNKGREDQFSRILSEIWLRLVKPVLDALSIKNPSKQNPERIWWCPTGPLSFLPIHAAGKYGVDEAFGSKLSDFVISSYIPSLTALIQGHHLHTHSSDEPKLLAVAQPSALGQRDIPGTQKELNLIQIHAAKTNIPVIRLEKCAATLASVQKGMSECSWVHFACHGVQNLSNPTKSALLLDGNSRMTLENIIGLSSSQRDLAFLSACQTATGDRGLQEESVHLAAGMLLAGYRSVIATMWSIMDNDAPQVASDVYEHLFKTSPPDSTQAAEALHLAVANLRDSKQSDKEKSFFRWVPFIHIGV
ncbi:TPR-like protein, partial [Mycena maculata]